MIATDSNPTAPHSRHRLCACLRPTAFASVGRKKENTETHGGIHPETDACPTRRHAYRWASSGQPRRTRCARPRPGSTATCRTTQPREQLHRRQLAHGRGISRIAVKISEACLPIPRLLGLLPAKRCKIVRRILRCGYDGPQHCAEECCGPNVERQPHRERNRVPGELSAAR